MKKKLIIIPNDKLTDYDTKGYSHEERHAYFNPNHEFNVSLLGINEDASEPFEYAGFQVYPSSKKPEDIRRIISEVKPDLVRGYNGTWAAALSGEIGKEFKIHSVASVHNLFPDKSVREVDRLFCLSDAVREKCLTLGAKKEKIRMRYNGIDMGVFQDYRGTPEVNKLKEKHSGQPKILSVGRLTWQKNLDNLFKASKIVQSHLPNLIHLHIGQLGNQKEKLEEIIEDMQANHIHFLPNTNQHFLANLYSWADAFTMASISEGFPSVYMESLACGTPVITSDIPPMNTLLIQDHNNGLTTNPNSPRDIATKIIKLLTNRRLYEKIQANARKSVEEYDTGKMQKHEAKLYKEILEK